MGLSGKLTRCAVATVGATAMAITAVPSASADGTPVMTSRAQSTSAAPKAVMHLKASWGFVRYDRTKRTYSVCDTKKDGYSVYGGYARDNGGGRPSKKYFTQSYDKNGSKKGCYEGGPLMKAKYYFMLCRSDAFWDTCAYTSRSY